MSCVEEEKHVVEALQKNEYPIETMTLNGRSMSHSSYSLLPLNSSTFPSVAAISVLNS